MNNAKEEAKILKLTEKRKSDAIIKIMKKADLEMTVCCLNALAEINDEAACNAIAHCMDSDASAIRVAACKAALVVNTDYMKTRVRHTLVKETDESVKAQIQEISNASKR